MLYRVAFVLGVLLQPVAGIAHAQRFDTTLVRPRTFIRATTVGQPATWTGGVAEVTAQAIFLRDARLGGSLRGSAVLQTAELATLERSVGRRYGRTLGIGIPVGLALGVGIGVLAAGHSRDGCGTSPPPAGQTGCYYTSSDRALSNAIYGVMGAGLGLFGGIIYGVAAAPHRWDPVPVRP